MKGVTDKIGRVLLGRSNIRPAFTTSVKIGKLLPHPKNRLPDFQIAAVHKTSCCVKEHKTDVA